MDERAFYSESPDHQARDLELPLLPHAGHLRICAGWCARRRTACPAGADERDRAKFAKAQSYMVLLDDKAACKNLRCRRRFDISGVKTTAFL